HVPAPVERNPGRAVDVRQIRELLRLGDGDPPLDVANRVQILVQLADVRGTEAPLQPADLFGDGIEQALFESVALGNRFGIDLAAFAEETLEDDAGITFERQLRRRVPIADS